LKIINRYRKDWGLRRWTRIDDGFSQLAQISQLCREFDFSRQEVPASFHYIGSLAADRQAQADDSFPWDRLDGRPLVFASMGTIPGHANLAVLRKVAEACAELPVQLVLALGRWNEQGDSARGKLGKLPGDQILVDFAPQLALLDRAALLVTHAGVNTVLESLTRGVPMVALPRSTDQMGMGARIEYSGVGLGTSFKHCTAKELRGLIERVLAEQTFRHRAEAIGHAIRAAGGARRGAEIAEEALVKRQPVVAS
jgi:MGT family glycosyltransferase